MPPDETVCTCWVDPHGAKTCAAHPGAVSKTPEPPCMRHARQHQKDALELRAKVPDAQAVADMYTAQAQEAKDERVKKGLLVLAKRAADEAAGLEKHAATLEETATRVLAEGKAS